jgi:hypothetical protein
MKKPANVKKKPRRKKTSRKIIELKSVSLAPEMINERGRPPEYREEYAAEAVKLCELGATDEDLAYFFEVSWRTIKRWEGRYPEFNKALKRGKEAADDRVERSLYSRATGYTFDSEKVFNNDGLITRAKITEHVPPDVTACIFWLKNRRPAEWRDKTDHDHNHQHQLNLQGANMSIADAQALFRQARTMPLADLERSLKLVESSK